MKYLVLKVWSSVRPAGVVMTLGVLRVTEIDAPAAHERPMANTEHRLRNLTVEAYDAGCRSRVYAFDKSGVGSWFTWTTFDVINNHLDAHNLVDEG